VDCGTDRTGESPLREGAGAGRRGVTPGGADKRQPPQGVLWKVKPNGGKRVKDSGLRKLSRKGKGAHPEQTAVGGGRKAPARRSRGRSVRQNLRKRNPEEEQRTIRKSGRNTPEGRIRADFSKTWCKPLYGERSRLK